MMASLLIGLIGLTDLVRTGRRASLAWTFMLVLWAAFGAVAIYGLSAPPVFAVAIVLVTLGWVFAMPSDDSDLPRRLWPAPLLVIVVLGIMAITGEKVPAGGFLVDAYAVITGGIFRSASLSTTLAALAVTAFLLMSGNIIVRAALGRAQDQSERIATGRARVWQLRVWGKTVGEVGEVGEREAAKSTKPVLKGGRLVGPIERVLIVVLALVGAYVLIAALVAAKGVVRFPEISEDRTFGSKAEEFLVGSFASWTVAALAALYLATVIYL